MARSSVVAAGNNRQLPVSPHAPGPPPGDPRGAVGRRIRIISAGATQVVTQAAFLRARFVGTLRLRVMQGIDSEPLAHSALPAASKEILGQYIPFAERAALELGMRLAVRTDFAPLVELEVNHTHEGLSLCPAFNPHWSDVGEQNGFWIQASDEKDRVVAMTATRVYDLAGRFGEAMRTMRIFYDVPADHAAAGDAVFVEALEADAWTGRVVFSGGTWVRPSHRRRGFTKIVPRLMRTISTARWNPPRFFTMVSPENDRNGVTRAYGSWRLEGRVRTNLSQWGGDKQWLLFSMTPEVLLSDLKDSMLRPDWH